MTKYDTIIIGAGLAGLSLGAILAEKENQRILILEKDCFTGGRLVSFTGTGEGLNLQGKTINDAQYKEVLNSANSDYFDSLPDLKEIRSRNLLRGYSFEAGLHITFWGNKGKLAAFFNYFGKHIDFPGNEGFVVLDSDTDALYDLKQGSQYGWMDEESSIITKNLLREMALAKPEEINNWRKISFGDWMRNRTSDRKAWEFLSAVASPHMAMGDPDMMNAGEFIQFMNDAGKIGMNFISGSTGIVSKPGFILLADTLTGIIEENGGEIKLNSPVTEVIIRRGRATGVRFRNGDEEITVESENIVCTLPVRKIFSIIPENKFPEEFVHYIKNDFWGPGIITSYTGLKNNIFETSGINPKSWVLIPAFIKSEQGFRGDVDCSCFIQSSYSPSLAPEGKSILSMGMCLTDEEIYDPAKVRLVFTEAEKHISKAFPSFEADREWSLYLTGPGCYGDMPHVNCEKPSNRSPWIKGLYFAGDSYGKKVKGSGMDSALHSAIDCADEISGGNYIEQILPEYLR